MGIHTFQLKLLPELQKTVDQIYWESPPPPLKGRGFPKKLQYSQFLPVYFTIVHYYNGYLYRASF